MARKLDRSEWRSFLDRISKVLAGKRAEIEIASLGVGDQVEAAWLPFFGVVYDPKDDVIEIALEGLDHLIQHPQEIWADIGPGEVITSFEIVDTSGARQIIKLRDPLMLPSASAD
jgi:hypothetical protein